MARGDAVELLSFHAAKGREWRRVIVTGVETGLVPHSASTAGERRAEEARLLYVALTRGADEVIVTSAATRGGRPTKPSPFLAGLPEPVRAVPPPARLRRPAPPPVDPVLERLDVWRAGVARAAGVSPHVVCPDAVLAAIAAARPASPDQLVEVAGVSVLMAGRFGERILAAVAGP
jgi:DNA helicase-2/ATP-dependent DNA helicase PcrA